jgi:hypothetical protein
MVATLTMPAYDYPTQCMSGFLLRYIAPRMEPVHLWGFTDTEKNFMRVLQASDVLIGCGHGDPDLFTGQYQEILLDARNVPDMRGKVAFLISCETAQALGKAMVNAGCEGYIGWNDDLVWILDADKITTPWEDPYAASAMLPIIDGVNALLDGETLLEAQNVMLSSMERAIELEDNPFLKSCLRFNKSNVRIYGDYGAKVAPRAAIRPPIPPPPLPPIKATETTNQS